MKILSYCYRDIKVVISWYKILVISPTPKSRSKFTRAVLVADFYHRGVNGPTTTGGTVLYI